MEWFERVNAAVAEAVGMDPASIAPSSADIETLLDVARIAAHDSGDRKNAPVLCYVLGLARAGGATLEELAAVVRSAEEQS